MDSHKNERYHRTRELSLNERVELIDTALEEMGLLPVPGSVAKLVEWLTIRGYEPKMFTLACRVVKSRHVG